jgi:flavodoxin
MRIVVVYDSVYGNTKRVAQAIAQALGDELRGEVPVIPVGEAKTSELRSVDLLVIGSPTHGALPTEATQAFVKELGEPANSTSRVAAFDTRLSWGFLRKHGFAGDRIAEELGPRGWTIEGSPGGFYVRGLRKGPLKKGELERATRWAKALVEGATP